MRAGAEVARSDAITALVNSHLGEARAAITVETERW